MYIKKKSVMYRRSKQFTRAHVIIRQGHVYITPMNYNTVSTMLDVKNSKILYTVY